MRPQRLALIKRVGLVTFEAALLLIYARLRLLNSYAIRAPRISFGDTADYLKTASLSIFTSDFWLSPKPFITPLFIKILGSDPEMIFRVQVALSILCWAVLAVVCALVIRSYPLKFLASLIVLGFSLSRQVLLWDSLVLSESIHFSLAALFYAFGLLLASRWSHLNAAIFIILAALLAFTRDTNAYMLLLAGLLICSLLLLLKGPRLRLLLIGGSLVLIFLLTSLFASLGYHSYAALLNVVTGRILQDPQYTVYMQSHGMPVSYLALPDSANISDWDALHDPRLGTLRVWVRDHGNSALAGFLWHFKADTLQKPLEDPMGILSPDLYYYSATGFHSILENTPFIELIYPMRFGVIMFGLATVAAAFMSAVAWQQKRAIWLLPLLMILLAYPQILLVWNTDPHDIPRHALPLNVQWRLGLWLLILLLADDLLIRLAPTLQNWLIRLSDYFHAFTHRQTPTARRPEVHELSRGFSPARSQSTSPYRMI